MPAFKSMVQLKRCDGLVDTGVVQRATFERDLLETNLSDLPWRVGPLKPGEEDDHEYRSEISERKAAIIRAAGAETAALPAAAVLAEPYNPQGEGLQGGGEGLEAGRTL